MRNSLGSYQTGYVIGIRYRANFSVSDLFGSIIDEIIYTKNSPFNEKIFPLLQHTKADEKVLINPDNNNRLTINTSNIVLDINDIGIKSIYHTLDNIEHGKELIPTFYLQKKLDKKYHIDYIFSPIELINRTKIFNIGNFDKWKEISDHVPIIWEY